MVSGETIQQRHHLTVCRIIDDSVDSWQWEVILRAGFIEVSEIDAHAPLAILLFDRHGVCQPCWVFDFSNNICI
jgi:hypothetical protein